MKISLWGGQGDRITVRFTSTNHMYLSRGFRDECLRIIDEMNEEEESRGEPLVSFHIWVSDQISDESGLVMIFAPATTESLEDPDKDGSKRSLYKASMSKPQIWARGIADQPGGSVIQDSVELTVTEFDFDEARIKHNYKTPRRQVMIGNFPLIHEKK